MADTKQNLENQPSEQLDEDVLEKKQTQTPLEKETDGGHLLRMPVFLMLGLLVFFGWAAFFEIDQTVRSTGQVIPSARTQIIQAADGGVLYKLFAQEGETVEKGQVIAVLEKERVGATYEQSRSKVASLDIALMRAKAESEGADLVYPPMYDEYPELVSVQQTLFERRKHSLQDKLNTLNISLAMAKDELQMNEKLLTTGDASQLEVMRSKRQLNDIQGEISEVKNNYIQSASEEASNLEAELNVERYKLDERKSMLDHTDIKAPVAGIVKYLKLNTLGGVLRPGDEIMQISPTQSKMLVEVKVNPADIGQLELGLPVKIQFDAFDYSIYGGLEGTLTYISSDTLIEESGEGASTYYRARVTVDSNYQEDNPKFSGIPLKPGLTTTVDIKIGTRSVLRYLAKPIVRGFSGALKER